MTRYLSATAEADKTNAAMAISDLIISFKAESLFPLYVDQLREILVADVIEHLSRPF